MAKNTAVVVVKDVCSLEKSFSKCQGILKKRSIEDVDLC